MKTEWERFVDSVDCWGKYPDWCRNNEEGLLVNVG